VPRKPRKARVRRNSLQRPDTDDGGALRAKLRAPAKINLCLNVLGKRPDGYHEISSVMQAVGLFDFVTVSWKAGTEGLDVRVVCDNPLVPVGTDNLAVRAAALMAERYGRGGLVNISLEKQIPMAAGLAGGSADAAAVIVALRELWRLPCSLAQIAAAGSSIGADVAFCVMSCGAANGVAGSPDSNERYGGKKSVAAGVPGAGYCAVAGGIGEKLDAFVPAKAAYVVLVKPDLAVSTAEIYRGYDDDFGSEVEDGIDSCVALRRGLEAGEEDTIFANTRNSLEPVTIFRYPEVGTVISKLSELSKDCGVNAKVMMSGSGPTVFAYTFSRGEAETLYGKAAREFSDMRVCFAETKFD